MPHPRRRSRSSLAVAELETRLVPTNTIPELISDIRPGPAGSNPEQTVQVVSGVLAFAANDGATGTELWASNGTSSGTQIVRNIFDFSEPIGSNPTDLTPINGLLFFAANGLEGRELWVSNGTSSGTTLVSDINTQGDSNPSSLTNVNGTLFFYASDGKNGRELWTSDGTSAGTRMVLNIAPGPASSVLSGPGINVGGVFYFPAEDAVGALFDGVELWRSDGTSAGTVLVRDIRPGGMGSYPSSLTEFKGQVAFAANDGFTPEVWISNGTSAGTVKISSIAPVSGSGAVPDELTNIGGTLFFAATSLSNGRELFKTNGTATGTALVREINTGGSGSYSSDPSNLTNVGGTLYFAASDGVSGQELWTSDGTSTGTNLVADITPGAIGSAIDYITDVAGVAYFAAAEADLPTELWRSDGTSTGTTLIDLEPNTDAEPYALIASSNRLFFAAHRSDVGRELFTLLEDNIAPTIVNIDSSATDGSYYTGSSIPITITFSEPVTLTGSGLTLTLDSGATIVIDPFSSPSTTATGTYFVGSGEQSPDLNVLDVSPIGTSQIADAVGNAADLSLPGMNLAVTSDLMINLPNTPPTITDIPNQSVTAGTTIGPLVYFVNDVEAGTGPLTVSVSTDNPGLIPISAVTLSGSGGERSITINTPAGQSGIAVLTLTVTDGGGLTATDTVTVFVNGPPTISDILDVTVVAGNTVGPLAVDIGGNLTPPGNLLLSATSDNAAIPPGAITLSGTGSSRFITVNTTAGISTTTTITVTVTDPNNGFTATDTFVIVQSVVPPTITDIPNQTVFAGNAIGPIPFTVGSNPTLPGNLVLSVSSNNAAIPASAVTFGGSGANRTITVATSAGLSATTTLTVTVTDPGNGLTATDTITIVQTVPNLAPTVSDIGNQLIVAGNTLGPIGFLVGDDSTPAASLGVVVASSNPSLVPTNAITLGGSGANRTVSVATAAGQTGTATITVTVTDQGGLSTSDTFDLTITNKLVPQTVTKDFTIGRGADAGTSILRFFNPDGTERLSFAPFGTDYTCGVRTATADFNGDGVPDYAAGMGGHKWPSRVIVFDGVTQAELFNILPFGDQYRHGVHLSAGNINGDGFAELAISTEQGGGARVRVFSPTSNGFVQLADFFALQDANGIADTSFHGGASTAIGDLNKDGFGELFFAAGAGGGPRVAVFNGSTLGPNGGPKLIGDFMVFEANLRNGSFLSVGDIDADGIIDLVAAPSLGGGPRISIFSGAALLNSNLVRIADFFVGDSDGRGGRRVAVKNLDNDAFRDLLVGGGPGDSNTVTAFSGKDLVTPGPDTPLFEMEAFTGFPIGVWVG